MHTYDPKKLSVVWGSLILHGWADGDAISAERKEDAYSLKVGVDGEGTRTRNLNGSGRITLRLAQSSSSNNDLSAEHAKDLMSGTAVYPFLCKDGSGSTIIAAESAWIVKSSNVSFGKESGTREWILETHNLNIFVGGNNK